VSETAGHHPGQLRHRRRRLWSGARGRLLLIVLTVMLIVGAYAIGLNMDRSNLAASRQLVGQLQAESQKLKKTNAEQSARIVTLQSQLDNAQAQLNAIKPAQDTYDIKPNQSLVVANGRLTIGLIGSPDNDSININVNGTQHRATTGDVITVKPDTATNCRIAVESFDMFRALIVASCAAAKP